ncbi:MAG: cyanophycin synthetase, partial [Paraglaciecola sp.]
MKVLSTNIYVGPNIYANFPVIRYQIDLGELENWPSVKLGQEFIDGLINAIPTLQSHGCSYSEQGGFIRRLREDEGTWVGHIWEHVALELQNLAGSPVNFGKTRSLDKPGCYNVVYQYKQRDVGLEAGKLGLRLLAHLMPNEVQQAISADIDP